MSIPSLNIVLYEPQIPQNTGNIMRLCACTGSSLYIVGKTGFHLTDRHLKRAGMDYRDFVEPKFYSEIGDLIKEFPENSFYFLSTKATRKYTDVEFKNGDFLLFGSETRGLPSEVLFSSENTLRHNAIRIPMLQDMRSLNLANSVAVVLYEALRQLEF